ncbi:hypothetical protein [Deinococcus fonticola]|uniref:hypothetical protein n=1 Tax=Deinococcus fonticola TaxID=2528713 RepID=UPI001431F5CD|nr:hypothetical protein [Deinococcus fonticola]
MSATVIRNLDEGQVRVELEDGQIVIALCPIWLRPRSLIQVRKEAGITWRVCGR